MASRIPNEERMVTGLTMAMRTKLKKNRHKGGWENETIVALFAGLRREVRELEDAVCGAIRNPKLLDAVRLEAADVANFAGFIADNADYDRGFSRDKKKRTPR